MKPVAPIAKYADMFSAMGTEPRLRIMQLLLSAHPEGLVVGEIQSELGIPSSTLSHHLEKLKTEDLVKVRREAPSSGTPPTPKRCRSCWDSSTPNAAPATKLSSRPTSSNFANRRNHEYAQHQGSRQREIRPGRPARDRPEEARAAAPVPRSTTAVATRSPPTSTTAIRRTSSRRKPCWPRSAAATRPRWPS